MAGLGLHLRVSTSDKSGERDERLGVRTGISGRNPLCWLPTEQFSEWGDTDCEYWTDGAENTRVKNYRILVCVPLLLGGYFSVFL